MLIYQRKRPYLNCLDSWIPSLAQIQICYDKNIKSISIQDWFSLNLLKIEYSEQIMGNNQQQGKSQARKQIAVVTHDKQIVLHYPYKLKLIISYASTFPHNFEGLKLWDSNILLSRYIVMNTHKFKNVNVIQLPSGTGIIGITLRKWTTSNKIVMVDTSQQIVQNIKHNIQKNNVQNILPITMQWNQSQNFKTRYDIILASDPFFHRCKPFNLFDILQNFRQKNGSLILAAPKSQKLSQFFKFVESNEYVVSKQKINNEEYLSSPLFNQVEGEKEFSQLAKGQISIYVISKTDQIQPHKQMIKQETSTSNQKYKDSQVRAKKIQENKINEKYKNKQVESLVQTKSKQKNKQIQQRQNFIQKQQKFKTDQLQLQKNERKQVHKNIETNQKNLGNIEKRIQLSHNQNEPKAEKKKEENVKAQAIQKQELKQKKIPIIKQKDVQTIVKQKEEDVVHIQEPSNSIKSRQSGNIQVIEGNASDNNRKTQIRSMKIEKTQQEQRLQQKQSSHQHQKEPIYQHKQLENPQLQQGLQQGQSVQVIKQTQIKQNQVQSQNIKQQTVEQQKNQIQVHKNKQIRQLEQDEQLKPMDQQAKQKNINQQELFETQQKPKQTNQIQNVEELKKKEQLNTNGILQEQKVIKNQQVTQKIQQNTTQQQDRPQIKQKTQLQDSQKIQQFTQDRSITNTNTDTANEDQSVSVGQGSLETQIITHNKEQDEEKFDNQEKEQQKEQEKEQQSNEQKKGNENKKKKKKKR